MRDCASQQLRPNIMIEKRLEKRSKKRLKKRLKKNSIFFSIIFSIFFPIFFSPQEMSGNQRGFEFQCCLSCGHMEKWTKRLKKRLNFFSIFFSIIFPIFSSIFFSIFIHGRSYYLPKNHFPIQFSGTLNTLISLQEGSYY